MPRANVAVEADARVGVDALVEVLAAGEAADVPHDPLEADLQLLEPLGDVAQLAGQEADVVAVDGHGGAPSVPALQPERAARNSLSWARPPRCSDGHPASPAKALARGRRRRVLQTHLRFDVARIRASAMAAMASR